MVGEVWVCELAATWEECIVAVEGWLTTTHDRTAAEALEDWRSAGSSMQKLRPTQNAAAGVADVASEPMVVVRLMPPKDDVESQH